MKRILPIVGILLALTSVGSSQTPSTQPAASQPSTEQTTQAVTTQPAPDPQTVKDLRSIIAQQSAEIKKLKAELSAKGATTTAFVEPVTILAFKLARYAAVNPSFSPSGNNVVAGIEGHYQFKNNTSKMVTAFKGTLVFTDEFGDKRRYQIKVPSISIAPHGTATESEKVNFQIDGDMTKYKVEIEDVTVIN